MLFHEGCKQSPKLPWFHLLLLWGTAWSFRRMLTIVCADKKLVFKMLWCCVPVCVYDTRVQMGMFVTACTWRSADNFTELVFSFHLSMGSGTELRLSGLQDKCFNAEPSHWLCNACLKMKISFIVTSIWENEVSKMSNLCFTTFPIRNMEEKLPHSSSHRNIQTCIGIHHRDRLGGVGTQGHPQLHSKFKDSPGYTNTVFKLYRAHA